MKFIFSSWFSVSILIALIIFVPYNVSYFTLKPFDFWIFILLIFNINHIKIPNNSLVKIILGIAFLSVFSTFLQALKDSQTLDLVYFSNFYRYFRLILIMVLINSLSLNNSKISQLIKSYFYLGAIIVLICIFQIFSISPFADIFNNIYNNENLTSGIIGYDVVDRFGGIMANPNSMAVLLTSFAGVAITSLTHKKRRNILSIAGNVVFYVLVLIIVAVFTASRTSVLILLLMTLIWLLTSEFRRSLYLFLIFPALFILISSKIDLTQYENLDRVFNLFESRTTSGELGDVIELTGRENLWNERLSVFFAKGHDLAIIFGMGFTSLYYDFADNGLITFFINLGIVGLIYKLFLYYITIRLLYFLFTNRRIYSCMAVSLILLSLILFEVSAETIDHIKLGPLFFAFIQIGFQLEINKLNVE